MSFRIDDEQLLEKYKVIWTKIEDLVNTELNSLPIYYDRYRNTKIRTYTGKAYGYFHGLNVPEDDIKCEYFTVILTCIRKQILPASKFRQFCL